MKYEGEVFPGEVTCIEDSDVEVKVMHTRANAWKWPRPEDKIFYSRNKIECVINPPSVSGNREQFVFEDICKLAWRVQADTFRYLHNQPTVFITLSLASLGPRYSTPHQTT